MFILRKSIICVVLLPLIIFGCKETEYEDVQFTTEYSVYLKAESDTSLAKGQQLIPYFSVLDSINPNEDENYREYAGDIKAIHIRELMGRIISINKPSKIMDAQMHIYSDSSAALCEISGEMLMQGSILDLADFEDEYPDIKDMFLKNQLIYINFAGNTEEENTVFTMEFVMKVDITAEPL